MTARRFRRTPATGRARDWPGKDLGMNRLESSFHVLCSLAKITHRFQPFSLRLALNTFYRPDFLLIDALGEDELICVEVKGPKAWDDALAKYKIAAEMHGYFGWAFLKQPVPKARLELTHTTLAAPQEIALRKRLQLV